MKLEAGQSHMGSYRGNGANRKGNGANRNSICFWCEDYDQKDKKSAETYPQSKLGNEVDKMYTDRESRKTSVPKRGIQAPNTLRSVG